MDYRDYYTQSQLKELGFTMGMIKELVTEPPILETNPYYKKSRPMKLWERSYIDGIMSSRKFRVAKEKADVRRESAKKATQTKENKAKDALMEAISRITVQKIDEDTLNKRTIYAKREWYYCNHDFEHYFGLGNGSEVPKDVMDRWRVNYIRHNLTQYDDTLFSMKGTVGVKENYLKYRKAVFLKIAETYPAYSEECCRQYNNSISETVFRDAV